MEERKNMIKNQKKQIVNKLIEELQNNKNCLFLSYQNLKTKEIDTLKKELKKTKTKFSIVKNTLLEKALNIIGIKNNQYREIKKQIAPLKNPTAIAFFNDKNQWLDGLKIFYKFITNQKKLNFRLGFFENNLYQANQLLQLSLLPSKNEILAKLISSIKNPVQKFILTTNNPIKKFVFILNQKSMKGGEKNE